MGTLKMLHMKACKGRNKARHLKNALEYIYNPKDTNRVSEKWMGGNCGQNAKEIYENMIRWKKNLWKRRGKTGLSLYFQLQRKVNWMKNWLIE